MTCYQWRFIILQMDNQILVFLILILHLNNLQRFLIKGKKHKNR